MNHWTLLIMVSFGFLLASCNPSSELNKNRPSPDHDSTSLVSEEGGPGINALPLDSTATDRENWQKPQMVISLLGDLSVMTVADIGAGTGYFTMRLARKAKKVIAIDIDEEMLKYIDRQVKKNRDTLELNIETRYTNADDPSLHPDEVDLVLIVNTYPYITDRVNYFQKVRSGISEGGRLVVIDFKKRKLPVGPPVDQKVSASLVVNQLDSAGFSPIEINSNSLEYQFIVTAFKNSDASEIVTQGAPSTRPGTP